MATCVASSALGDLFDPISVLVEDAISIEPPELVYDFIDRLLINQLPPVPVGERNQNPAHAHFGLRARAASRRGRPKECSPRCSPGCPPVRLARCPPVRILSLIHI